MVKVEIKRIKIPPRMFFEDSVQMPYPKVLITINRDTKNTNISDITSHS